jgi:hypothetical protein
MWSVAPPDPDDVVCDQPVAASYQLERALALPDSASAQQQDTHIQDLDQGTVSLDLHRKNLPQAKRAASRCRAKATSGSLLTHDQA